MWSKDRITPTTRSFESRMLADPGCGSEVWEALDREISQSGKNRGQIVAHWKFQFAAALKPVVRAFAIAPPGSAMERAVSICFRIPSSSGRNCC